MDAPSIDSLVTTGSNLGWLLARAKLLALVLGPAGMGLFSQVAMLQALASSLALLGAGPGLTRAVARARSQGDGAAMSRLVATTGAATLAATTLLALAVAGAAVPLSRALLGTPEYAPLFPLVALALAGSSAWQYGVALWGAFRATRRMALGALSSFVGGTAAFWACLQLGSGTFGSALAGLAAAGVVAAGAAGATLPGLFRELRLRLPRPWFDTKAAREIYGLGLVALALAAADQVAQLGLRTAVIRTLGAGPNGLYQAALGLSQLSLTLASTYVFGYAFARVCESGPQDQADLTRRTASLAAAVLSLLGGLYLLAAAPLIHLLLSRDFLPAREVLPWQVGGNLLFGLGMALGLAILPARGWRAWAVHGLGAIGPDPGLRPPAGEPGPAQDRPGVAGPRGGLRGPGVPPDPARPPRPVGGAVAGPLRRGNGGAGRRGGPGSRAGHPAPGPVGDVPDPMGRLPAVTGGGSRGLAGTRTQPGRGIFRPREEQEVESAGLQMKLLVSKRGRKRHVLTTRGFRPHSQPRKANRNILFTSRPSGCAILGMVELVTEVPMKLDAIPPRPPLGNRPESPGWLAETRHSPQREVVGEVGVHNPLSGLTSSARPLAARSPLAGPRVGPTASPSPEDAVLQARDLAGPTWGSLTATAKPDAKVEVREAARLMLDGPGLRKGEVPYRMHE